MKRSLLILMVAICSLTALVAGNKPKAVACTTFKTDIHCEGCSTKVMNNVAALGKGVKDVKVDVPTKEITVTYDSTKTNPENIIKGFKTIAVQAEVK